MAYIKKQLEENRQRIMPKLTIAEAWIKHSAALTKDYGAQITAEEKAASQERDKRHFRTPMTKNRKKRSMRQFP